MSDIEGKEDTRNPCRCNCSYKDQLVTKWAGSSTIHGVEHIFSGKSTIRRLVWTALVLAASIVCLYFIIDRIIYFDSRPTATTVNVRINENGLPFPAVTICNLSPVRRSYANAQNLSTFLPFLFYTDFNSLQQLQEDSCPNLADQLDDEQLSLTMKDVFTNGAFGVNDFVLSCLFGNSQNVMNCRSRLRPTLTSVGLCYTFNGFGDPMSPPVVTSRGERYGLRMIFNISQNEYAYSINGNAGVKVSIHNRDEVPEIELSGISVPPRLHASIALYPQESFSRPGITSCLPLDTTLEFFSDRTYSLSTCMANEYFIRSIEQCGCIDAASTPPATGRYSSVRNCTVRDACCLLNTFLATEGNSSCLPVCNETTHQPSVSYSQYPSNLILNEIALFNQESSLAIEQNVLAINVFFGSLHTTVSVTDYSYDLSALVADIGGQLALFVGASVISFLEIILLCFDETKRGVCVTGKKAKRRMSEAHEMSVRRKRKEESPEKEQTDDVETKIV